MSRSWYSPLPGGVRLAVQIQPNAKKTEVVGVLEDVLKIKLAAPPIEGKANEALVKWLAGALGVSRSAVTLTHGQTNKKKLLEVTGVTLEDVGRLLNR
ncbi:MULTISPECIES: DUF167 domain-containing protein [unclassified Duganella]|uniref:DUF167 domain-containing protein n=1 Tax=unclassified Duganella TaxID=2636909 RepID=UPI0006F4A60A|nr:MULTISPECIES: DUF167 domain-containing protein [unclassified Duganella]KQV53757.1 hypothetical protein ASD07_04170 [Duganella sp. Root336D2]KRB83687.1 hypothetical protein ASE26_11000 [Duganella sp. Root198D2]